MPKRSTASSRATTRSQSVVRRSKPRLNPLRVTDTFRRFVLDQLAGVEDIASRAMFGGVGLYRRDVFFGIVAGDVLYLKVDGTNRRDYDRAGMPPFKPYANRPVTMHYFAVPVSVLESSGELEKWARKAIKAAAPRRST